MERCAEFVFGPRTVKPFHILYSLVSILGTTVDLCVIWDVADTFNGLIDGAWWAQEKKSEFFL